MARILVVDDRPDNLLVIERYLSAAGHQVDTVSDAESALQRIVGAEPYELFVLDVVLPGMSGYELCQRIRSRAATESTPVLFLTGERGRLPDKIKGFESGANDYLQKPVDEAELLARVGVLLKLQNALTEVRDAKGQLEKLVEDRTVELREALQSLERQRNLWEHAVHSLPAAVLICDHDFGLVHGNDVAESTFGAMPAGTALRSGPLASFFDDAARKELESGARVLREVVTRDGRQRIFEAELTHLDGECPKLLVHLVDVTEREAVAAADDRRQVAELQGRIQQLEKQLGSDYRMTQVLGHAPAMDRVHQAVGQLRSSRASVLIAGESGTGKELVARAIHFDGDLRERPFVPVHCGAIPESLAESEFFGYVKGAFTGAAADSKGLFEQADGGTIFLDEIGELTPDVQSKLLRVLQSGEIRPVGSTTVKNVDVRLIAATHRSLADLVREGKFREDLYYRLNVVQVDLPPLRERIEDVPLLAQHLLEKHSARAGGDASSVKGISREALAVLEAHSWEGNVRELENVIVRALALTRGSSIQVEDLAPRVQASAAPRAPQASPKPSSQPAVGKSEDVAAMLSSIPTETAGGLPFQSLSAPAEVASLSMAGDASKHGSFAALGQAGTAGFPKAEVDSTIRNADAIPSADVNPFLLPRVMAEAERAAIIRALKKVEGNRLLAAQLLGIGKSSLYRKIKDLDIRY